MPQPLIGTIPLRLEPAPGYRVRVTALNPTTGGTVAGVVVRDVAIQVRPYHLDADAPSVVTVQPSPSDLPIDAVESKAVNVSYTVTGTNIVLTWQAVTGTVGYEFLLDGKRVSNSWNGALTTVTFAIPQDGAQHVYQVVALKVGDQGSVTYQVGQAPPPPPPPPPSTGAHGARALPSGPFTERTTAAWYRTTAGGTVSKVRVHDAPDYGVALMGYFTPAPPAPSTGAWNVSDVVGHHIGHAPPTMNGTGEAGLWFGQQVNVSRALGYGTWMGAWTGAQCRDSTITDLTCAILNADGSLGKLPGIGLYIEHATRRVVIDGLTIISAHNGVNVEWWYPDSYAKWVAAELPGAPAGKGGSWSVEIRNFDITTDAWGMFLDAGTCGFNIHDGVIRGKNGIAHPKNLAVPTMPNRIDWNTIDFRGTGTKDYVHSNPIG